MVSDSKKLLVAFCSLLFFSSCFHGPKDWYNDAMKKGLRGDFYRIENPKQKDIDIYECFKYAEKNNYVVVNYTSQRVNKYGGVSETLYTLDFLPPHPIVAKHAR